MDVSWHTTQQNVFASVGDDKQLFIWDMRDSARSHPRQRVTVHDREILATIGLWDTRSLAHRLHSLEGHQDEVLQLSWSPNAPTVPASTSSDRRIHVWDLSRIGEEQTPDDAEDGAPELMFIHGGHTGRPTDVCWAPRPKGASKDSGGKGGGELSGWEVASAAEDNVLMVWSMSANIWAGEGKAIEEEELEVDDD